jgi:hypothetical protein
MSETPLPSTLDTAAPEVRRERFERSWLAWKPGEEPPRWEHFLPELAVPCDGELIFLLLQIDIEFRVKAGLPALLAERYFEHPRLGQADARLSQAQQVELIRWEYQQHWKHGDRVARRAYVERFPEHAALHDLKPRWNCPHCKRTAIPLDDEGATEATCPWCGQTHSVSSLFPTPVERPHVSVPAGTQDGLDLRNYELLDQLGKGGMGEVYRCCDPSLGRDLAIKVMRPQCGGPAAERRFLREARITGSLQHPGIVPVHNLGQLPDGRLYYTMKLVRGQTLKDRLADGPATLAERLTELLAIFEKVCQAIAYAHSKGVIHRDLKPANIMIGRFGEVQVMDWGLAKLLSPQGIAAPSTEPAEAGGTVIRTEVEGGPADLSCEGAPMGTPQYMPPEQAGGDLELMDERADVFALGAILCVLLTGQPPYLQGDAREALRRAKRADLAEALSRLDGCGADAELVALCEECLAPKRGGRPRDAGVVAERVAAYQKGVQERLRRAELERAAAQVKAAEERKRRRVTVALAAAVLLLLVGSGAGALWW